MPPLIDGRFPCSDFNEGNVAIFCATPLKINMEPKNHPIAKENHFPNLHFWIPC